MKIVTLLGVIATASILLFQNCGQLESNQNRNVASNIPNGEKPLLKNQIRIVGGNTVGSKVESVATYNIQGGQIVLGGDMAVGKATLLQESDTFKFQKGRLVPISSQGQFQIAGHADPTARLWTGGKVYVAIKTADYSEAEVQLIERRIQELNDIFKNPPGGALEIGIDITIIDENDTSQPNRILMGNFSDPDAEFTVCWSFLGMVGGEQQMSNSSECLNDRAFIHELVHAFGLSHEHMRLDRDNYITVNEDNIPQEHKLQFEKLNIAGAAVGDYDLLSLMHYRPNSFSSNQAPAFTLKPQYAQLTGRVGMGTTFSNGDLETLAYLYPANRQPQRITQVPPTPSQVQNFQATNVTTSSVELEWDLLPENEKIRHYLIQAHLTPSSPSAQRTGTSSNTTTLRDLEPNTDYTIYIWGGNATGEFASSSRIEIKTQNGTPDVPAPPQNSACERLSDTVKNCKDVAFDFLSCFGPFKISNTPGTEFDWIETDPESGNERVGFSCLNADSNSPDTEDSDNNEKRAVNCDSLDSPQRSCSDLTSDFRTCHGPFTVTNNAGTEFDWIENQPVPGEKKIAFTCLNAN